MPPPGQQIQNNHDGQSAAWTLLNKGPARWKYCLTFQSWIRGARLLAISTAGWGFGCSNSCSCSAHLRADGWHDAGIPTQERARVNYDAYILGPGDSLQIELLDLPELSGTFTIGPDGTMYLPRLRALYVEGLTVEELRGFLTQQFSAFVLQPELYVTPVGYRPIRNMSVEKYAGLDITH